MGLPGRATLARMAPTTSPLANLRDRLLIAALIVALLYAGRAVLIPLAYSVLIAMVLHPFVSGLERRGLSRGLAITAGLLIVTLLIGGIGGLLIWELHAFQKELQGLTARAHGDLANLRLWLTEGLGITPEQQAATSSMLFGRLPDRLAPLAVAVGNALFGMVYNGLLIPVLTALILYGRGALVAGITTVVPAPMRPQLPSILQRCVQRFAAFILGMVKVYVIVGVLNSLGLLALGVPNAVLFGMLTAIMTIVPYVGIIISAMLPITVSWIATGSLWAPLGVVAVFAFVQYLEANVIFPRVVGAQLGLNTLASILLILFGALLWGVSGMVLSLPFVSILLLLSEDIPGWESARALLGRGMAKGART